MATDVSQTSDFDPFNQKQRSGSMSLTAVPGTATDNAGSSSSSAVPPSQPSPSPAPAPASSPAPDAAVSEADKMVNEVLHSEIGVSTLLTRLKQTISSAKEFANFLKKRATLEEDHALGMKKLCRTTHDTMLRPDHKQGSFSEAYVSMMGVHDKIAQNGLQFSSSLQQMHDDLVELAAIAEKNRKGWKQNGLAAEQRVADIEAAMRKSKAKLDALADEYDRARTGDTSQKGAKMFGFKGHKSSAQHEEDLLRKVQAADQDYHSRVDLLQAERAELLRSTRPEAVKALQDILRECDAGLALQIQKFASFNEKLLLSNGLSISPLNKEGDAKSLREVVSGINNERDLSEYISGHHKQLPPRSGELKYEKHPVLGGGQAHAMPGAAAQQAPYGQSQYQFNSQAPQAQPPTQQSFNSPMPTVPTIPAAQRPSSRGHERSFSHNNALSNQPSTQQQQPQQSHPTRNSAQAAVPSSRYNGAGGTMSSQAPPQLGALPFQQQSQPPPPSQGPSSGAMNPLKQHPYSGHDSQAPSSGYAAGRRQSPPQPQSARPVFGVSLSRLYERDGLAVPQVVYQCITAVDFYGLNVEGIYRLSGSVPHVNKLKQMFDMNSDSPNLDFRNPENFFHDVNSVAGLLKLFLRDLTDPLLTREHYQAFIDAAKNDDEVVRRDSLHAIINNLPDPNYATLRALALHLHRVMEASHTNRMNSQNLAIVFGPTLMGTGAHSDIADAGWQVRVIDTILQNTLEIFDDD